MFYTFMLLWEHQIFIVIYLWIFTSCLLPMEIFILSILLLHKSHNKPKYFTSFVFPWNCLLVCFSEFSCSPVWPWASYTAEGDLEILSSCLHLMCWYYRSEPHGVFLQLHFVKQGVFFFLIRISYLHLFSRILIIELTQLYNNFQSLCKIMEFAMIFLIIYILAIILCSYVHAHWPFLPLSYSV